MAKDKIEIAFEQWKNRVSNNRINAICRPCWEINYCPYGSLVEDFPISNEREYRCRIFGHDCPVFYVAEPFTETKKMRTITRNISHPTKFKVIRRDKCVCQMCGKNVSDEEINFDHVIPWSKGGSSDDKNIRLLCSECNKKRGNSYEHEFLVSHFREAYYSPKPLSLEMLADLLRLTTLFYVLEAKYSDVSEERFCTVLGSDDLETDKFMYLLISHIFDILRADEPFLPTKKKMQLLQYRWGIRDGHIHSIEETCTKMHSDIPFYVEQEMLLLRQIGFVLEEKSKREQEYFLLTIAIKDVEELFNVKLAEIDGIS